MNRTPEDQARRASFWRTYIALLLVVVVVLLACTACALAPHALKVELEHVSHPTDGWPFEKQTPYTEDDLNQAQALAVWRHRGAYLEGGLGYNLRKRNGGGFRGSAFLGTVRLGYEIPLREAR